VRQLEADVGIEPARCDLVQQAVIEGAALPGLFLVGYVFAQVVDADRHAHAVDGGGGGQHLIHRRAGDKARGHAPAHGRPLSQSTQGAALRQPDEERP